MHRRKFLLFSGAAASAALVGVACKKSDNPVVTPATPAVDLGTGDTGVLNYAYALEQLEAAFYVRVMQTTSWMNATEMEYLADIRDHEVAHRDFFKAALGSNRIQDLTPNFSSVNFADRTSVLNTAKAFEDLGVSAYNGAGRLLQSSDFLTLAGKIVSVEARHAALIRDLIANGTFAKLDDPDLVSLGADNSKGLDAVRTPAQVLAIANNFLSTPVSGANLPS
ncbi:ferritin-like domain-containing protein [Flaviaesturariibacter flavus]|uniref:Ferritin-like domain-containing protein n=2 Tax=Flaviaesturariibacter flavus TaxID=2502780 RepID=A0A4R1B9C5_9BACT|nr:ferritin-like domain-containing protein [Flaviaesturariibacter flavus]